MLFAGILLLLASVATMRIKQTAVPEEVVLPAGVGH